MASDQKGSNPLSWRQDRVLSMKVASSMQRPMDHNAKCAQIWPDHGTQWAFHTEAAMRLADADSACLAF